MVLLKYNNTVFLNTQPQTQPGEKLRTDQQNKEIEPISH